MAKPLTLKIAGEAEIELLKKHVSMLLEKRGIKISHPELIGHVKKTGTVIDERNDAVYVKFPPGMQEELLAQIPREFLMAGREPEGDIVLPHPENLFYTRPVMGSMFITTETGEERLVNIGDVAVYGQLVDELEHINMYCSLTYSLGELPPTTTDINCLFQNLSNNRKKHGYIQPYEAANAKYIIEMASIASGGLKNYKKRPIITSFSTITEPFMLKDMDAEALVRYAEIGVPISCGSLCTAGANVPITPGGTALMGASQALCIALLTQCVNPGTPCYVSVQPLMLDMMSTYTIQSNPVTNLTRMLTSQLIRQGYGLNYNVTGGGSDSFIPGPESVANVTMTTMSSALSGASFLANHGMCQTFKRFSPLQLIIDNEIIGMVKELRRGRKIDQEEIDYDEILTIGERETFIDKDHNLRHYREIYRPNLFTAVSREEWEAAGAKSLLERAKDFYSDFKKSFEPRVLPDDMRKELERVVLHANRELAGEDIDFNTFYKRR